VRDQFDLLITDPGNGLAAAINAAIRALPSNITYVNWLGDDDLLIAEGTRQLVSLLDKDPMSVLGFGHCRYIDASGNTLFDIKSGRWAVPLLRYGPQLISQPAMLFRRDSFEQAGGLDESLQWAFDLDLILKLSRLGRFSSISELAACYRWHGDALTVGSRSGSVREASKVRRRHLPSGVRRLSSIWELPLQAAIFLAGNLVSPLSRRR
jgi:GT2 family glycosyltransferase